MIHPGPSGTELTAEQARELDDTFLASDPYSQSCARIAMMLEWAEHDDRMGTPPAAAALPDTIRQFANQTGFIPAPVWSTHRRVRETQLAQDAFTLRHHLAESAMRLAWASVAADEADTTCVWEILSSSPNALPDVLEALDERFRDRSLNDFATLVLTPDHLDDFQPGSDIAHAVTIYAGWFDYATILLQRCDIALNAVNNKIKHGLAVRARDDVRLDLHVGPIPDDGLTVSRANSPALRLFDKPLVEAIHRAPTKPRAQAALEDTLVRVDLPTILGEAHMIAMLHGAMFHVLARAHFDGRDDLADHLGPPNHPGFPASAPMPPGGDHPSIVGMRFPLTEPAVAGSTRRSTAIALHDSLIPLDIAGEPMPGRVVPDEKD